MPTNTFTFANLMIAWSPESDRIVPGDTNGIIWRWEIL